LTTALRMITHSQTTMTVIKRKKLSR